MNLVIRLKVAFLFENRSSNQSCHQITGKVLSYFQKNGYFHEIDCYLIKIDDVIDIFDDLIN